MSRSDLPTFDEKGRQIKKCCRCKQYKVAAEFYRCRSRPDGLNDYCKDCYLEWRAGRREKLTGRISPKYLKPFKAPRATRRCPHCGYWYAPLRELWHGSICAICASERTTDRVAVTGGVKRPSVLPST